MSIVPYQDAPGLSGRERASTLIRSVRRRRGWSQDALAVRLVRAGLDGADRIQVSRWERDERVPGPHARERLALVLGIPADRLDRAARVSRAQRRALDCE